MFEEPIVLLLLGMAVVVGSVLLLRFHAFLALLLGALLVAALTPAASLEQYAASSGMSPDATASLVAASAGTRVAQGLGATCAKIGIVIALAAVIGRALLESGAAERIVRSAVSVLGEKRAPTGLLGSSFLLGIPVFFDTVFYLMIPLGKALSLRTGGNYLLYVLMIMTGATMAHSLVPPTPGPLFVAAELQVDMGLMILGGCTLGFFTVCYGYLHARWAAGRWDVPLRDTPDTSRAELEGLAARSEEDLPALWASLLPVLLPVLLISGRTVYDSLGLESATWAPWIAGLGDKNVALTLAAAVALGLLAWRKKGGTAALAPSVQAALQSGGVIILITAAGGAFGAVLQQTGISTRIGELSSEYSIGVLPLAFGCTVLVRTAQGSATVAMITATGIVAGLMDTASLGYHPLYVALAIGCGSKPFSWMNDSGFWVICRMSGLTEAEGLRIVTPLSAGMGFFGFALVLVASQVLPLV